MLEQGNGRIGPASLEVPPVILRWACNAECRFFKISFLKIVDTLQFPLFSFGRDLSEKEALFFRLKRRYVSENAVLIVLSKNDNIVKTPNDTPEGKKNGSIYLSPKYCKYYEKSESDSVGLLV